MNQPAQIRFEDGAAYEEMMGKWSRIVGETFLDWLAPPPALKWADVGCGNGAFTELVVERCAPSEVQGVDPSDSQLSFARSRHKAGVARFQRGDAMALPFSDDSFDAAVMALVIFFVPQPARGVGEMARVVKPGGSVSAYAWNVTAGGLPNEPIQAEMQAMGLQRLYPPSADASRMDNLKGLWADAGIEAIETREITAYRTFTDFNEYWDAIMHGGSVSQIIGKLPAADAALLKSRVIARMPADADGRVTHLARANAIKGRMRQS